MVETWSFREQFQGVRALPQLQHLFVRQDGGAIQDRITVFGKEQHT
jgi:hypothetical protein